MAQVGEPVTPGLIRAPPLQQMGAPTRPRRRQPPPAASRHSARLSNKKKVVGGVLAQAQAMICRRLGLPSTEQEECAAALQSYETVFDTTFAPPQMEALTALATEATMGRASRRALRSAV